jgi:RNA polymerase sigma-70 factor (ECF subfamily)
MDDPDGLLIRRSQAGNKVAFGKLASRYYEMVYAVVYGVLHHYETARDVTQEVFLKVFREISHFEGKSKFKTWLYRVAVNAALDEVRRKRPVESLDTTDAGQEEEEHTVVVADKAAGPRELATGAELQKLVGQALEQLSEEHRAVLVLREWQGLSYEEIAEALGIELGTVMSRLHYARKKLGEILKPIRKEY